MASMDLLWSSTYGTVDPGGVWTTNHYLIVRSKYREVIHAMILVQVDILESLILG